MYSDAPTKAPDIITCPGMITNVTSLLESQALANLMNCFSHMKTDRNTMGVYTKHTTTVGLVKTLNNSIVSDQDWGVNSRNLMNKYIKIVQI